MASSMEKTGKKRGTGLLVLFLVFVFSFFSFAAEDVTMKLDYGYRNTAKSGQLLPVTVTFDNESGEEVKGFLSVEIPGEDGSISYTSSVKVPEGISTVKRTVTIPDDISGGDGDCLLARLFDSDGVELSSVKTSVSYLGNGREVLCGILSEDQQDLLYLASISLGENLSTRVVTLNPADLPEEADGLNQLDVIVISRIDLSRLSDAAVDAVMEWVDNGGTLIFGTGETRTPFGQFREKIGDPELEFSSLQPVDMGMQYSADGPDGAVISLVIRTIRWDPSTAILESGERKLVQRRAFGKGAVCLCEMNLCDLNEFASEHPAFTQDLLEKAIGATGIERIQYSLLSGEERLTASRDLTNTYDEDRTVPVLPLAVLCLLFLLLCGTVLYRFLSAKGLAIYYMLGVLVVTLIFTLVFWLGSAGTRITSPFIRYGMVVESALSETGERKESLKGYLDLESPGTSAMTLELPAESSLRPVITGGEISVTSGKKKMLAVAGQKQFEENIFQVEEKTYPSGKPLSCTLQMGGEGISGTVTNGGNVPVAGVGLIFTGRIIELGSLDPGESVSFTETSGVFGPVGSYELVSGYFSGYLDQTEFSFQKEKLLANFLRESVALSEGKALLFGFAKAYTPDILSDTEYDTEGSTLFVSEETVPSCGEDGAFFRIPDTSPTVVSGSYDQQTGCLKGSGATILEYSLGSGYTLEGIRQAALSEELEGSQVTAFSGQLSLYNYSTGSYDLADAGKEAWTAEELKPYLSPANNLTVRYLPDEGGAGNAKVYLPALYAEGTETRELPESRREEPEKKEEKPVSSVPEKKEKETVSEGPVMGPVVIEEGARVPAEN